MWTSRQTLGDLVSDVEAYARADPKADTLPKAKA